MKVSTAYHEPYRPGKRVGYAKRGLLLISQRPQIEASHSKLSPISLHSYQAIFAGDGSARWKGRRVECVEQEQEGTISTIHQLVCQAQEVEAVFENLKATSIFSSV
ncbi:hypothetical protein PGTUg99_023027 [Puccinia graminis f. sp. tritici]|uniref:Uncharacterized protein n=1 Tax=Puccinia graminis f. sp. tritici TaxID=56615 RepID=A0A5B0Q854_PUCGR|nr:hypothetical protein PGTUg99_023027 [Puccinia graminis f. sp. tritici]